MSSAGGSDSTSRRSPAETVGQREASVMFAEERGVGRWENTTFIVLESRVQHSPQA